MNPPNTRLDAVGKYWPSMVVGSVGRRGNPYDNATAENFMKTLKVEAVYPMEAFEDVAADLLLFIDQVSLRQPITRPALGQIRSLILSTSRGALQVTTRPVARKGDEDI